MLEMAVANHNRRKSEPRTGRAGGALTTTGRTGRHAPRSRRGATCTWASAMAPDRPDRLHRRDRRAVTGLGRPLALDAVGVSVHGLELQHRPRPREDHRLARLPEPNLRHDRCRAAVGLDHALEHLV